MGDQGEVLALQQYISSLDKSTLPRILQVCSGVYFQGSVYELSGCEVCLSTGDLVKIIGLDLLSVSCEDIGSNTTFELPIDHLGLFKLVPEDLPYSTVEEMVSLLPVGVDACGSFTFISNNELIIDNFTVSAGTELTLLSMVHAKDGMSYARCQLTGSQGTFAEVLIPLNCHGEFFECESNRGYSLQEIMLSARLCRRRFRNARSKKCGGPLFFSPIYQVQGIMHMRKNVVKFPSSLEVDVTDVTEQCKDLTFITPLSIAEVATQSREEFPTMSEILEGPEANRFFCCSWFKELHNGRNLVLHGWSNTSMVLACTPRGRKAQRYFLISLGYGGQMRRRAREFNSVYELYMASCHMPGLKVSVTRDCEAVEEEGVPALSVGEQLEVLGLQTKDASGAMQRVENLICRRIIEDDEDDDDDDDENWGTKSEISLPLFTAAHFAEKLLDKKKHCIADLSRNLPLEVKVVSRDRMLKDDPLEGLPALRLEEAIEENTVLASLPESPEQRFELPVRWLQLSLAFISDPLPWHYGQTPEFYTETVTEVTDHFYHEYQKLTQANVPAPPRPPKRRSSATDSKKKKEVKPSNTNPVFKRSSLSAKLDTLSLDQKSTLTECNTPPRPPKISEDPPPVPGKCFSEHSTMSNMYVQTPRKQNEMQPKTARESSDSDHDYEVVDESLKDSHDSIMSY